MSPIIQRRNSYYWYILYCEINNILLTFHFVYFVGRAIHEFKIPMKYNVPNHFCNSAYILKSTNLIFHEHVPCRKARNIRAHEIKLFHCT